MVGKLGVLDETEARELLNMCEERDLRTWLMTAPTSTSFSQSHSAGVGRGRFLVSVTDEREAVGSGLPSTPVFGKAICEEVRGGTTTSEVTAWPGVSAQMSTLAPELAVRRRL